MHPSISPFPNSALTSALIQSATRVRVLGMLDYLEGGIKHLPESHRAAIVLSWILLTLGAAIYFCCIHNTCICGFYLTRNQTFPILHSIYIVSWFWFIYKHNLSKHTTVSLTSYIYLLLIVIYTAIILLVFTRFIYITCITVNHRQWIEKNS